jgi:hypothetical protein
MIRRLSSVACFVVIGLVLPVLFLVHDTEHIERTHVSTADLVNQSLVVQTQGFVAGSSDSLPGVFDGRAASHFVDVRGVVLNAEVAMILLSVLAIVLGASRNVFYEAGIGVFAAVVLLGGLAYLDFSLFFDWFHRLFFEPGTYVFSGSSLTLQLFPVRFFEVLAFDAVLGWLCSAVIYFSLGFIRRR